MLSSYKGGGYNDAQADAVAELLYHCGANVEMNYSVSASGTQTSRVALALSEVFGYSPSIRYLQKEAYRWDEWKDMLRKELDLGYPMIYDGQSSSGGHAFVCDGYSEDGTFHINWGWDGYSNGYFVLSTLDAEGMAMDIAMDRRSCWRFAPSKAGRNILSGLT